MLRRVLGSCLAAAFLAALPAGAAHAQETAWGTSRSFSTGGSKPLGIAAGLFGTAEQAVAVANTGSDSVAILRPDAVGGLNSPQTLGRSIGSAPQYVTSIVSTFPWRSLALTQGGKGLVEHVGMEADGTFGTFVEPLLADGSGSTAQIAVGHFDAKPREDIAAAHPAQDRVYIFTDATSPAVYGPAPPIDGVDGAYALATADIDRDGKTDLVVGGNGTVRVFLGEGAAAFTPAPALPGFIGQVVDLAIGDLNGDGDLDIAAAIDQVGLQVFYGGAGNTFPFSYFVSATLSGVALADLDGLPGLEIAITLVSHVYVLKRRGDGSYGVDNRPSAGDQPRDLAALDIDGDADVDLAVTNFVGTGATGGTVTVLYNAAQPAVTLNPGALDFGGQAPGTIGPEQTVSVTNSGHRRLSPQSARTTTGDFLVSRDGCAGSTVAVGESCTVGVRFAPGSAGALSDTLRVSSDAPGSPQVVALSGTGVVAATPPAAASAALKLRLLASTSKVRRGRNVRLRFSASTAGTLTLDVVLRGKRVARVTKRVQAGNGSVTWNGKRRGRTAPRGLYTLRLTLRTEAASAVVSKRVRLR